MTPSASSRRLPHNVEGALWMLASSVTYIGMTTLVKYLGEDYSASVQNFYRQLASLIAVLPFVLRAPVKTLRTSRMHLILFRSMCGTAGVILAFYSFQKLPMADANALSFTRPLWVTLLAAVILKEHLGVHRLLAVGVGFVGVLVILRPGLHQTAYGLPQAAALGSAFLLALSIAGMKSLTRDLSAFSVLAWSAILGVVLTFPFAVTSWAWPTPRDAALLFLMGALGVTNQLVFIKGMAVGDAAAMAPLDYIRLVLAVASGFFLFSELPDLLTIGGALVIVVSTLSITFRELRAARKARAIAEVAPEA